MPWGEPEDFGPPEGYTTEERAEQMFVAGAQACREMIARFVEQGGAHATAASIRANWHPGWGDDPGRPDDVIGDPWTA